MTKPRKNARAQKRSVPKLPANESAAPTPDNDIQPKVPEAPSVEMVEPLNQNAFQLIMQIIDNADFKGREVSQVLAVKLELARVAGLRQTGDGK